MAFNPPRNLETQKEWLRTRCRLERAELCAHLQEAKAHGPWWGALLRRAGGGAGLLSAFPVLAWLFKTWFLQGRGGMSWWSKGLASWLLLRFKNPAVWVIQGSKTCLKKHPLVVAGLAVAAVVTVLATWHRRN